MFDYANAQLLGRATDDAKFLESEGRIIKATFTIACNIPIQKADGKTSKSIFRKIMALGGFAIYLYDCQKEDSLKGRLINVVGVMDDERVSNDEYCPVVRVAPGAGCIKVMDRRTKYE